ncbi:MAG: glycosyltransferase [Bacteroidetes bacterium]|nr:glycosyltransferase [Bacteroidota bacterium]
MRRIGIVTTWHDRGASYVSRQYEQLLRDAFEVYIYARGGYYARTDPDFNKYNVYWGKISGRPVSAALDIKDLLAWIRINAIDTVIFNEQAWWPPVIACNKAGIITGAYVDYYTKETIPLFAAYDFLLCNTKRHYGAFSWHSNAFYLPWGTETDVYTPSRKELYPECLTFFHSCGYSPERKGTDVFLRAAGSLTGRFQILIHTQKSLEEMGDEVNRIIDDLERQGKLSIVTGTIKPPGLYTKGDVYVYPSRLDGIGLTLPEAISSGLAVVVTDHPPMNEFYNSDFGLNIPIVKQYSRQDGYYWDMVEPSIEFLHRHLQDMIDGRYDIDEMKRRARSYATRALDWNKRKDELVATVAKINKNECGKVFDVIQMISKYEDSRKSHLLKVYNTLPWLLEPILRIRRRIIRRVSL